MYHGAIPQNGCRRVLPALVWRIENRFIPVESLLCSTPVAAEGALLLAI